MSKLGIGIVGYGEFAEFSHAAWSSLPDVEVVAAADLNRARVPANLTYHESWQDLLRDPSVQIVVISTPPISHAPMALAAVHAGKHVFVEKPPATTLEDARELLAAAEASGCIVAVDYMLRYNPVVEALKGIGVSRALGKLQHVSVSNYAYDGKLGPGHWFWDKSLSGGILVEHAVHFFDIVSYISPSHPVRLTAHGVSRQPGMEDKVVATVEYQDGLICTHYHHFFRPWWFERQTFRFAYDLGEVDVEGWIPLTARLRAVVSDEGARAVRELFPGANVEEGPVDIQRITGSAAVHPSGQQASGEIVSEVTAGGARYNVNRVLDMDYEAPAGKMDVYTQCVRSAMEDLARAVRDPAHTPRIALGQVMDSIRIASAGAEFVEDGEKASLLP